MSKTSSSHYDVLVLGAGIIGINTAYFAMKQGLSVCVVDRQVDAGLETSFANGGQISVSHAEPWANPSAPFKVLKWLFDARAPLLFRPRLDVHQWRWILRFLGDCLPSRSNRHTVELVKLATESRAALQRVRADERIDYDHETRGILHFYRDEREFEAGARAAELMRRFGCERQVIDAGQVLAIEPAFAESRERIVGATYTADDESGDALAYTQGLARRCIAGGVDMLFGSSVTALDADRHGRSIKAAEIRTPEGFRRITAKSIVVAMGSWSAPFLRPYGVGLNIYPAKGYSVTIPIDGSNTAPHTSLTDDQYKLVYSRLGDRLRIAGTAELSGYAPHLNDARCQAILANVRNLFPRAGAFERATFWAGLRPATPSNLPYIGRTGYRNLWLNTGHGTLGWTLGAGSGQRMAEMLADGTGPRCA